MKICFLGNSHLAAIKRAWDLAPRAADPDVIFFGSSARSTEALRLEQRSLVTEDAAVSASFRLTAGTDTIDLDRFDAFVLAGITFEFRFFLAIFERHVLLRHRHLRPHRSLLSDGAYRETIAELFRTRPGRRLIATITKVTGKPVFCLPSPCPDKTSASQPKVRSRVQNGDGAMMAELYSLYCEEAAGLARQHNYVFLPQPAQTLASPGFTKHKYSVDSEECGWTLDRAGPQVRSDVWHMNALYGKAVLEQVLPELSKQLADANRVRELASG